MALALQLAEQGLYTSQPNPRVGCVIVKHDQIIGQGAHLKAGEAHAEVLALQQAGANANEADVYISLEPCNHYGRTPPCVDALINAGVKRVVVAMQDPNPLVAGHGIQRLKAYGIVVEIGLCEKEAMVLNLGFVSRMTRQLPYVRSKIAASLDGRTALNNGKSLWITDEAARQDVQHWRAQSCAIITGIGTVLNDNPSLNVRLQSQPSGRALRQPLRVIVDSQLRTPVDCKMLTLEHSQGSPVVIAYAKDVNNRAAAFSASGAELLHLPEINGRVDLPALLSNLAERGVNEVLLEAGQGLNGAFLQANLIDEFIFYYAPKLMGADAKSMFAIPELTEMQQVTDLQIVDVRHIGVDIRIRATPVKPK
ncbi:MAG: bifunctional diaminohydroxyphosphoribosylaminopyrimidine deaminase/5-amino-6-(5-phosphoribosylamino)uracil reductase RibD [Methylotenera sp.]|nr:bifunctional diaminohydroxyphosphoribosylaminopyrimidine deaminase/5-amino-6-(5-phosphoribosylamino)uracil reductase RibD [Methylotenera sp.]MSQ00076.1 bifunctional diaminohydroxyphosphoribosylaminopyrimidine deaminase/5-amino-6-(5-phosphoribosylamino)uracil reductase RibD [Methylotenera sp.]